MSIQPRVRKIHKGDSVRVVGMFCDFFQDLLPVMDKDSRFHLMKRQRNKVDDAVSRQAGYVSLFSNSPQGYLLYQQRPGALFIDQLYVHPFFRGYGFGRELVKKVAKEALIDSSWVTLQLPQRTSGTYARARDFYSSLGFEFRGQDSYYLDNMILKPAQAGKLFVNTKDFCRRD